MYDRIMMSFFYFCLCGFSWHGVGFSRNKWCHFVHLYRSWKVSGNIKTAKTTGISLAAELCAYVDNSGYLRSLRFLQNL